MIKIWYLALKKIAYFWFLQGMIIFPGGERLKWNFWRGGSILGAGFKKSRGGRGQRKKSLPWGGMDIFWNYTIRIKLSVKLKCYHGLQSRSR